VPTIAVNDIEICYESFGPDDAPPLLLVMGLGAQMTLWSPGFISELLERGFRVIRFDNRDVGLSTKSQGDPPDVMALFVKYAEGQPIEAPYTLSTMANDAVGLLDALDIRAAHIVGASMGGMIVQVMAIEHPDRVLSLTSIMSTTGHPDVGQPDPESMIALLAPAPTDASIRQVSLFRSQRSGQPETAPSSCVSSTSRRWSSTADRTPSSPCPAAKRPQRRFPAPNCSSSA
jgi:pimeloyl-ACP methyl ester carboxylesterase